MDPQPLLEMGQISLAPSKASDRAPSLHLFTCTRPTTSGTRAPVSSRMVIPGFPGLDGFLELLIPGFPGFDGFLELVIRGLPGLDSYKDQASTG